MGTASDTAGEAQRRWLRHRRDRDRSAADLVVGVAASFTADPVEAFLGVRLLDGGRRPTFSFAPYNQLHQLCFDPSSQVGQVDVLVVLWRLEDVFAVDTAAALAGDDAALAEVADGAAKLGGAFAALAATAAYPVLLALPPLPAPIGFDLLDSRVGVRRQQLHSAAADAFLQAVSASPARLADLGGWLETYGSTSAHDVGKWLTYKQPYSSGFWQLVGAGLAEQILRETQPAPKCLVLDCDNTLWGGVVAEDGIGGIELGSAYPGSAYVEFQRAVRRLRNDGVLLAIASKNDEDAVREVFAEHDEMVLSASDLAAWQVGWQPKSQGLRAIAAELNIGLDSLVFVDDSDYELAEVRAAVPEVTCLRVPDETAELPDLIARSGLFRNLRISAEDLDRTEMILGERSRAARGATLSREDFLASLGLVVDYFPVRREHVGRVAQLTNKTNQFNLTTIRRSEPEIAALLESSDHLVRALRVADSFGDYGLVGVAVITIAGTRWELETVLMSCRVLGRGVESAFLARIAAEATEHGVTELVGHYVPTPKNGLVADLLPSHGFVAAADGSFRASPATVPGAPAHISFA